MKVHCVHYEHVYKLQLLNNWLCIIIKILKMKTKHDWTWYIVSYSIRIPWIWYKQILNKNNNRSKTC